MSRPRLLLPAAGAAAALVLAGAGIGAAPASADTVVPAFHVGSVAGAAWMVPAGVHALAVEIAGSAGGGGGPVNFPGTDWALTTDGNGGAGGLLRVTIPVTPGDTLVFYTSTVGGPTNSDKASPGAGGAGWLPGGAGNTGSLQGHAGAGGDRKSVV